MNSLYISHIREAMDELAIIPYCTNDASKRDTMTLCIECIQIAFPVHLTPDDVAYTHARTSAFRAVELITNVLNQEKEFEAVTVEISDCLELCAGYFSDNKKGLSFESPIRFSPKATL